MSIRIAAIKEQAFAGLMITQLKEAGLTPFEITNSGHISLGGSEQYYYIATTEEEAAQTREALIDLGYGEYLIKK